MTSEQLTLLKANPMASILKYGKLLLKKEITKTQYDWIIRQISTPTTPTATAQDTPEAKEPVNDVGADTQTADGGRKDTRGLDPISERTEETAGTTTHTDAVAGKSQKARLLALLKDGKWHTTPDIMQRVYKINEKAGNCRIPSRVCELRKEGHKIESKHMHHGVWAYKLETFLPMYGG